jgi:F0F1-type ATP synthase assembly protein I
MPIGPTLGAACLGVVLGWLLRYFLDRIEKLNMKMFASLVSVLCGGVVFKMFPDPFRYAGWFYPMGLLLGILLYPFLTMFERMLHREAEQDQMPKKRNEP